jgi:hypothetical protein
MLGFAYLSTPPRLNFLGRFGVVASCRKNRAQRCLSIRAVPYRMLVERHVKAIDGAQYHVGCCRHSGREQGGLNRTDFSAAQLVPV